MWSFPYVFFPWEMIHKQWVLRLVGDFSDPTSMDPAGAGFSMLT
jgi:hypothetical protein